MQKFIWFGISHSLTRSLSLFVGIQSNYLSSVFNQVFSAAGLWTKYVLVFFIKNIARRLGVGVLPPGQGAGAQGRGGGAGRALRGGGIQDRSLQRGAGARENSI